MPSVLLIDTKPHITAVLKRKFEAEGFRVLIKESAGQTTMSSTVSPDLIVLGKAHTLQGNAPAMSSPRVTSDVPIILITAGPDKQLTPDIPHLSMPFRPSQLMEMAHRAIAPLN